MGKKRPVGVTILAVLFILGGVGNLLSGLFYMGGAGMMKPHFSVAQYKDFFQKTNPDMPPKDMEKFEKEVAPFMENMVLAQNEIINSDILNAYILVNSVMGLIGLTMGIGLFRLKEYARKGMVIFVLSSVPLMLAFHYIVMQNMIAITAKYMPEISRGPVNMQSTVPVMVAIQGIFMLGISLLITYYLTRPKVKEQFRLVG